MTTNPIPAEAVEAAFGAFLDSFCDDEAGRIEPVSALDGTTGYAMTGGNDARAVFANALTAAAPLIAAQAIADLRAGIEALRDEMPVLTTELCGHEPDEHSEGCCDVCDLAFAIDSEVRDRLDALLRGGAK